MLCSRPIKSSTASRLFQPAPPQEIVQFLQHMYRGFGDPSLGRRLDQALAQANEEQMAEARGAVREFLGDLPFYAGAEDAYGVASAFVFVLGDIVERGGGRAEAEP